MLTYELNGQILTHTDDEEAAIRAAWAAADTAALAVAYARQRENAYPGIADQLDMIWHAIDRGDPLDKNSAFYIARATVKSAFPKPGS